MATDQRLRLLSAAFDFTSHAPKGRKVLMAARVLFNSPMPGEAREIPAQVPGAKVAGGRVHGPLLSNRHLLEIATWNTGEASDLRARGTRSHAEHQFYMFMQGRAFDQIEAELSHSPCTGCCDLLAGLIRGRKVSATLRWAKQYQWGVQATNLYSLNELIRAGWKLAAPGTAIPPGTAGLPIQLL